MFRLSQLPAILRNELSRFAQTRNPSVVVVTRKGNVKDVSNVHYNHATNTVTIETR